MISNEIKYHGMGLVLAALTFVALAGFEVGLIAGFIWFYLL